MFYEPDKWVIVRCTNGSDVVDKVLGSWFGSFTDGESWRLSSGIVDIQEFPDRYEIENYSGSVYNCPKGAEGMTDYAAQTLKSFQSKLPEGSTMEIVEINQ